MKNARFTKGQVIYQVSEWSRTEIKETTRTRLGNNRVEIRVRTRTVDACGLKQVTFYDHGMDWVFQRCRRADDKCLHATREEAFAYAAQLVERHIALDLANRSHSAWLSEVCHEYVVNPELFDDYSEAMRKELV